MDLDDSIPKLILLTSDSLECRSGLQSLEGDFRVIAPPSLVETLASEKFELAAAEEINEITELRVEAIEHAHGMSFSYRVGEKNVLFTPSVPRKITLTWTDRQTGKKTYGELQPHMKDLLDELLASKETVDTYSKTLDRLRQISPDVWLPAKPLVDQNANLYDDDWDGYLGANRRAVDWAAAKVDVQTQSQ